MANNTYVNKVALADGTTLIDLTADTITAADLASGVTAHDASGAPITGSSTKDSDTSSDTAANSSAIRSTGAVPWTYCISCHCCFVMMILRGFDPSYGPTTPTSSSWSMSRAARE